MQRLAVFLHGGFVCSLFMFAIPASGRRAMRKSSYAVLLGSLLLPFAAHADDPYLKLGVGQSYFDYGDVTKNETGYSIAYGAKYDKVWGLEAGYVYFGRNRIDLPEDLGGPFVLKAETVYLAGTGTVALNPQAELFGKLGLAVNRTSAEGHSETRSRMMAGVGSLWHLTKEWGTSLEYNHYGREDGGSLSQLSLNAVYKF